MSAARGAPGRTRAPSTRRSRARPSGADRVDRSWVHCPDPCHSDLVGQHLVQALTLPEEAERPIGLEHDLGRLGVRVVVDWSASWGTAKRRTVIVTCPCCIAPNR